MRAHFFWLAGPELLGWSAKPANGFALAGRKTGCVGLVNDFPTSDQISTAENYRPGSESENTGCVADNQTLFS